MICGIVMLPNALKSLNKVVVVRYFVVAEVDYIQNREFFGVALRVVLTL